MITTPSRPRQWPSMGKWCGRRWKEGSLPTGGHRHLCAENLRTETGCPCVARGQERNRRAAGGDGRQSGRASRTTLPGKRATSSRQGAASASAGHVRGTEEPRVLQPRCYCHPRGEHRVASNGSKTRRAAPRGRARDSRLCVRGTGRGAVSGDTPPQMPPRCPAGPATTPATPGSGEQSPGC